MKAIRPRAEPFEVRHSESADEGRPRKARPHAVNGAASKPRRLLALAVVKGVAAKPWRLLAVAVVKDVAAKPWRLLAVAVVIAVGGAVLAAQIARPHPAIAAVVARTWTVPDFPSNTMPADVAAAILAARDAVVGNPASHEAWYEYAAQLQAHDQVGPSIEAYRRAGQLRPDDPRPPYLMAILMAAEGAPLDETLALFDQSLELDPLYPPSHLRRGQVLATAGRLEEARASLTRAVEIDPSFPLAHRELGLVLLSLGDVGAALVHLEFAAELVPDDQPTWIGLAQAYQRAGRDAEAVNSGRQADRLVEAMSYRDSVYADVHSRNQGTLGLLSTAYQHERVGRFGDALPLLLAARARLTDWAPLEWRLSEAYAAIGEERLAEDHRRRAEALDARAPGFPP